MASIPRCTARTKRGRRCRLNAWGNDPTCLLHHPKKQREEICRKMLLAEELKVPQKFLPHVTTNDLERVQESEAIEKMAADRIPQPKAKTELMSPQFDRAAAAKAFLSSDDTEHRSSLLIGQLAMCMPLRKHSIDKAASLMRSLKPRTSLEVMLFSQMTAVHTAAMYQLGDLAESGNIDLCISRATRLLRTFCMQVEALQCLRGRGKQKITVRHIQVNAGQAVVGVRG